MTYGQLFMRMNPNVKVVENGTCVWIFFDEVNHDTMRKGWWDKEIPDDANDAGWISVKDRLPEKQTPVLVYVPPYSDEDEEYIGHVAMSYYTHSARGGYWAGTDGNIYGAIGIVHEPTHWMPLPEPPKEG